MIDLKRNNKKELVRATGIRTKSSSIYRPNQKDDFKISRGKFNNFLTCKRCFYLDRVKGFDPPGTPGWSLNETTDILLKREFDQCREAQIPHRVFINNGLGAVVPYDHPEIDDWRNSLTKGLQLRYKKTNIILSGGVDDIWQDLKTKELILVDYKSQAKRGLVNKKEYLDDPYHESYKIQMDFYAYLLKGMGHKIKNLSYFLVCNAKRDDDGFHKSMNFDEYLIPYEWNAEWIDEKIEEMIYIMNQERIPPQNESCKNCAYSEQYSKLFQDREPIEDEAIQKSLF